MSKHLQSRELTPRMKQVVRFMFDNPQMTQEQIGKAIGLSRGRVGAIIRSKRVLEAFPTLARARIKGMVPQAVQRMGQLMKQSDNLEVSRKVVERVLDTEKVLETTPSTQINVFQAMPSDELKRIVDETRTLPQFAIDAEIVSDTPDSGSALPSEEK